MMSDFWSSELGEVTGSAEDAFAKTFTRIPDGTMALARIEKFKNDLNDRTSETFLSIEWLLTDGDFKGQKVTQKIKAFDSDPKVRHRALNMLKLMYQLYDIKPKHANPPTDDDLKAFFGKTAGLKIRETEPDKNSGKQYNWVSEVHTAKGFKCETGIKLVVTHENLMPDGLETAFDRNKKGSASSMDDDIPF
jgi:hypothetical protein